MAENNFWIDLVATLQKARSKKQVKSDAKDLGDIKVPLIGTLNKFKTKAQIKQDSSSLNGTVNLTGKFNSKDVTTSIKQATQLAQRQANSNPVQLSLNVKKDKLINDIKILGQQNSKLFKDPNMSAKYYQLLNNGQLAVSEKEIRNLRLQLSGMRSEIKANNLAGLTLGDTFRKTFKRATELFTGAGGVILLSQQLKQAWTEALKLDKSYTDLIKVQDELSRSDYPDYLERCNKKAQKLATIQKDLIDSTTEFSKSGYNLSQSDALSEKATVLANVGDMSASDSAKAIISGVQAYDVIDGYDDVINKAGILIDKFNEIGNTASITTAEIAKGVQSVGSVFSDANTSVDEFIALLAAGNRQFQDADSLALGLRTSALRIRGASADLRKLGEDTEGVITSTSKLAEKIAGLTNLDGKGGVKILEDDEKTFRSIYDIYVDIGKVYSQMSDIDSSALLDLIAGKNRASAVSATLNNMSEAQEIYQNSLNATGSAQKEYDKYLESSEASLNRFKANMVEAYQSVINGETAKGILDTGNAVLTFANDLGLVESTLKGFIAIGIIKVLTTLSTTFKACAIQANNFGTALNTAKNMSSMTRGTIEYTNALNTLKAVSNNLSATQLKQVLASKALSESDRISILMTTGLTKAQAQAKLSQMGLTTSTKAQTTANASATASTFSLTAAVKGFGVSLKTAFMSNPVGISIMALSTLIGAISSNVSKYNEKIRETRQTNIDAATTASEQASELSNLYAQYIQLNSIQNRTSSQEEQFKSVIESITKAIGDKAEALSSLTAGTDQYTESLRDATKAELENQYAIAKIGAKAAEDELKDKTWDNWSGSQVTIQQNEQMTGNKEHMEALNEVRDILSAYEDIGQHGVEWEPINWDKNKNDMDAVVEYYNALLEARNKLVTSDNADFLMNSDIYKDINTTINDLSESVEKYTKQKYESLKLDYMWQNGIPATEEELKKMEQSIFDASNAGQVFQSMIKNFLSQDFISIIKTSKDELAATGETVKKSFIDSLSNLPTEKLEEYISLFNSGQLNEGSISSFSELKQLMKETGTDAETAIKSIKEYSNGFVISTDLISSIQKAYDLLQDVGKQYEKTGKISLSSLGSIVNKYPQLRTAVNEYVNGLISVDDMMGQLQTAYDNDAIAFRSAMAYKLSGNENFFSEIKNNNQTLFDNLAKAYGLDVSNWKTMAQAKAEIDQKLIQNLSSAWSKYYNIVFDSVSGLASLDGGMDYSHVGSHGMGAAKNKEQLEPQQAWSEANKQVNKYNQIINKLNEAANIQIDIPDFGGIGSADKPSSKEKTKKDFSDIIDWINIEIEQSQKKVDKIQGQISDTSNWKPKNILTDTAITEMSKQIEALQTQADAYQAEADSLNLSPSYLDKIKNGTLEIETITDEVISNNIKEYQKWYGEAENVRKKIDDVKKSMKELAQSKLDNIINDFDSLVSLMDKYSSYSKSLIQLQEELGESISDVDYNGLINQQEAIYNHLQSKYDSLSKELSKAVSSGAIKVGTDEWRKYQEELIGVNSEINKTVSSMNDFRKSIINLSFSELEKFADATSRVNNGISAMIELIGNEGLIDGGMETSRGLSRLALLGKQLSNAKQQAAEYGNAIEVLNEMYENGSLTQTEYNERLNEYTNAQLSAVKATKEAQDAILQFRYNAIQAEIDDMNNLIAAKKKALQTEKDYQDYLDSVNKKQTDINNLQAKIEELSLDPTDRKAYAQKLQLEKQLKDAKEELAKQQADYAYDKMLESLDKQGEEFEKAKNEELETLKSNTDAQEKVIKDYLGKVEKDHKIVYNTLTQYGKSYGITMTDELTSPWDSATSAMSTFQSAVGDAISQINIDIASIDLSKLTEMVSTMSGFSANGSGTPFEDVTGSGTWQKTSKGWWYGNSNDDYVSDGVYTIGGKQYSFNEDGYMKSGWDQSTGQWRYFEPENGQMVKSTWRKGADGKEYYLKSDGTMATDMAIKSKSENGYYYVNGDGVPEGGLLTYDEVKQRKITVGYKSGTTNSKPGLKYVNENGPELIVAKNGTVLNSVGGDTIFDNESTKRLWEFAHNPELFESFKKSIGAININVPKYDFSNIKTVSREPVTVEINTPLITVEGSADEKTLMKCGQMITSAIKNDLPRYITDGSKKSYLK